MWRRSKNCTTSTYNDINTTRSDFSPMSMTLGWSKMTMEHCYLTETRTKAITGLWRQTDLWNEDNRLFTTGHSFRNCPEIHFCFATSSHAEQDNGFMLALLQGMKNCFQSLLLIRRKYWQLLTHESLICHLCFSITLNGPTL